MRVRGRADRQGDADRRRGDGRGARESSFREAREQRRCVRKNHVRYERDRDQEQAIDDRPLDQRADERDRDRGGGVEGALGDLARQAAATANTTNRKRLS